MANTQYQYELKGTRNFSDFPPPPGVPYDKVVDGKVVARYVLNNGVLARVLTKEQQAAEDASSAIEARNAAAKARAKKANSEIGAAHANHVKAREKLGAAGRELNRSMEALWNELQRANTGLGHQDTAQDVIDYGLAVAGLVAIIATGPVSIPTIVAVGVGTAVVGAVNSYMRPKDADSVVGGAQWDDIAGLGGDSVGVVAEASNAAVELARYGQTARGVPVLNLVSSAAGAYSAANNTSRALSVPSWDAKGLSEFQGQLKDFKPTLFEKGGLKWEGVDLDNLEALRADTEEARRAYDEAQAADRAAVEAYIATVVTWVQPQGG